MSAGEMEDLVAVTPDGAYPLVLDAFLDRPESLGLRPVTRRLITDPLRDSSGDLTGLLRPLLGVYRKALAIRDFAGSGWEKKGARALEAHLHGQMRSMGWAEADCAAIVVEPEIEAWLRLPSPHLDRLVAERARKNRQLNTAQQREKLAELIDRHGGMAVTGKAVQPKEVFEDFLFLFGIPRSNAVYQRLARQESLAACVTPSFLRLREQLRIWFPAP